MTRRASAPGKIILSGEYAVVFGYPGIAAPAPKRVEVSFEPSKEWTIHWEGTTGDRDRADAYMNKILDACRAQGNMESGSLRVKNSIPLGKGMGSSTALAIAIARCVLHEPTRGRVLTIEDTMNPGHSGIDFSVIWNEETVMFRKGHPTERVGAPVQAYLRDGAYALIDTGSPNESTPELVAWIRKRYEAHEPETLAALKSIGRCTERILGGEDIHAVIRDHHRAQVNLGVVPETVQDLIAAIETGGGSAKVIGAGGRTGGGGMVLALHDNMDLLKTLQKNTASL